jgi:hypothetical protein
VHSSKNTREGFPRKAIDTHNFLFIPPLRGVSLIIRGEGEGEGKGESGKGGRRNEE